MAETARDIERGERRREMLAELAEVGLGLARSLSGLVDARVEQEKNSADAPSHSKDAVAAFDKMAQTVRRTLALEAKLADAVKARREKLITDGAAFAPSGACGRHAREGRPIMERAKPAAIAASSARLT